MIINNLNAVNNSNRQLVMAHAQTIMNYFTDAVEQNDCNVKIVIGFYTEIQDTINSIKDLEDAFNQPIYKPDYWKDYTYNDWTLADPPTNDIPGVIDHPLVIAEAKKAIKNKCFNCRLRLPQVQVSFDRAFLFEKLSIQIEVYKLNFKSNLKFSLCQSSFMFQRTCIPDLVRLIGLFLSAYAAILALRKLPKISLGIFVKAIIGQLMAKVVASLKITVDMNSTGIPCIITALRDVAHAMPTNENMKNRLSAEEYSVLPTKPGSKIWPKDYKPLSTVRKDLQDSVKRGEITQSAADQILDDYKKKNDTVNFYADKLQEETNRIQQQIDEGIKMITDVVDNAVEDVNSYIDSILGVINFLQCENKRTGTDFSEIIEYANKIQTVLNLISAIIAFMAKQFFRTELCKDAKTTEQLKDAIKNAPVPDLTTPDAIAEIVSEWTGSVVKLDSDGLNLLIYDSPAKQMLPKLTLLGCNFKEFANAHTIDNIIKEAINTVNDEDSPDRPSWNPDVPDRPTWSNDPSVVDAVDPININIPTNPYPWVDEDPYDEGDTPDPLKPYRDPDNGVIINDTLVPKKPGNTGGSNDDNSGTDDVDGPGNTPKKPNPKTPTHPKKPKPSDTGNKPPDISDKIPPIIGTIPLNPDVVDPIFKDWVDSIDDIVDFVYNPPIGKTPVGTDPVTPGDPDIVDTGTEDETISFFRETLNNDQKKYQPSLDECRSVEDVIAILQQLKI